MDITLKTKIALNVILINTVTSALINQHAFLVNITSIFIRTANV